MVTIRGVGGHVSLQDQTSPTCKDMRLEGSQTWKQAENGHLDQRVFTGPVFQHPPTHLANIMQIMMPVIFALNLKKHISVITGE